MKLNKPCKCSALIKAIDAYIAKVDEDIENNLKDAGFASPKKTVRHMKELEDEVADHLKKDTKMILTTMKDYDDLDEFAEDGWPTLRDSDELVEKLTRTFSDQFSKAIPEYTSEYIKRVESDATISRIGLTHQTTSWISSWSGKLAEYMKLSDNSTIEKILSDGLKNGKSVADTAKKISESGIRDAGYRARRTATTEMLRAHSVAQQESFMQSPAVESKMWRHSGWRQYARENHMAIDGQTVKKDETFTLFGADGGLYTPMYPRDAGLPPGESINCGCVVEPIVSEYVLGLSLEERNRLRDEAIKELNGNQDDTNTSEENHENDERIERIKQSGILNRPYRELNKAEYNKAYKESQKAVSKADREQIAKHTKSDGSPGGYVATHNYQTINRAVRDGKVDQLDADDKNTIESMRMATGSYSLKQDTLLTRYVNSDYLYNVFGVQDKDGKDFGNGFIMANKANARSVLEQMDKHIGSIVTEKSVLSTSVMPEKNVVKDYKAVRMKIEAPEGTNCYIPRNARESECILGENTELYVKSVSLMPYENYSAGIIEMYCTVVNGVE